MIGTYFKKGRGGRVLFRAYSQGTFCKARIHFKKPVLGNGAFLLASVLFALNFSTCLS